MAVIGATSLPLQLDRLGRVEQEFPSAKANSIGLFITGLVLLALGVGGILWSASMFVNAFSGGYTSDTRTGLTVIASFVALFTLCILFMGGLMAGSFFRPKTNVTLYEKGLGIFTGKKLTAVVPWENITHVLQSVTQYKTYGMTTSMLYIYVIKLDDNRQFSFGNLLKDVSVLGNRIQKATFPLILTRTVAAYNAGEPVHFGALTLSHAGIATKNKNITWSDVSGARLSNGQLMIQQQGRWFNWTTVNVGETPNIFVLTAFLDHIISAKAQ